MEKDPTLARLTLQDSCFHMADKILDPSGPFFSPKSKERFFKGDLTNHCQNVWSGQGSR